jgi:CBS domain containing-hemolysin-like protein
LFTAIAATGKSYFEFIVLVPLLSFSFVGYTFIRSSRIKREDSEFVYIHWQIARRWSFFFAIVLSVVVTVAILGWLSYTYLGLMKEAAFALVGGLSFLPTLVSVLILIVIEMESLHHARVGTLPEWAKRRFQGV